MKIYISFLAALSLATAAVQAAPPSDQSIEQMMSVMQVEKMLGQAIEQMETGMRTGMDQGMQQSLHGKTPTPAQKAKIAEFQTKLASVLKDELSFAKMKDLYLQVYRETFTSGRGKQHYCVL